MNKELRITPIKIVSETEPTNDQFQAAARAEYMRRCEIFDYLREAFVEDIEVSFRGDSFFVCSINCICAGLNPALPN